MISSVIDSKKWWKSNRRKYNKGLLIAGISAFLLYAISGSLLLVGKDSAFEITLFTIFFQGVGYLIMMGIANIFYGLGSIIDSRFNKGNKENFRKRVFNLGFWFSFCLPFLIPVGVVIKYLIIRN
jgi:hypothetical protein